VKSVAGAVTAACALLVWGATAATDPQFRLAAVDVADLAHTRTIVDVRGEAAKTPLAAAAFRLLEDGAPAAKATRTVKFRDTQMPLALLVAVDMSQSMKGAPLAAIRAGIAQLVSRRRAGDRVALLSFADETRWEARWDATDAQLRKAFETLDVRGNRTRLYDGVWAGLDELSQRTERDADFPARQLVLVISDGHDEGSGNTRAQLVARLGEARVRVDAVGLARSPAWLQNLQSISDVAFGQFRRAAAAPELTSLLERGIDDVLDSPVLEFESALQADGARHRIGVRHEPTAWSQELAVTLPAASFFSRPIVWAGAGGAAVLVAAGLVALVFRRPRTVGPVVSASQAVPLPPSSTVPSLRRTDTAPRPVTRPTPPVDNEPTRIEQAPPAPPSGARAGTLLAPRTSAVPGTLAFTAGPYAGKRFPLDTDAVWLGANANNQVCLSADPSVSGHHACVTREGGFYRLYDNGSLNHTWVNGQRLEGSPVLLSAGDRLRIGTSECTIEC
jgi:hypothetical protein